MARPVRIRSWVVSTNLFSSPITTISSFFVQKIWSNFANTAPMILLLLLLLKEWLKAPTHSSNNAARGKTNKPNKQYAGA